MVACFGRRQSGRPFPAGKLRLLFHAVAGLRPDGNPLRRRSDRIEAAAVVAAVLLAVAAVPFTVLAGVSVRDDLALVAQHQAEAQHPVVATVLEDPPVNAATVHGASQNLVRIRWTTDEGREQVDSTPVSDRVRRGTELTVWTTSDGRLVSAPLTPSQIVAEAVAGALALQAAVTGLAAAALWGVRRALDRRRYRAWDAEWFYVNRMGELE